MRIVATKQNEFKDDLSHFGSSDKESIWTGSKTMPRPGISKILGNIKQLGDRFIGLIVEVVEK